MLGYFKPYQKGEPLYIALPLHLLRTMEENKNGEGQNQDRIHPEH